MRRDPTWNEGRNAGGEGEMLGAENGHWNRKKQAAEGHDLVYAMFLRQFLAYFDRADNKEQARTNIHPEYRDRNARRSGSQDKNRGLVKRNRRHWQAQVRE